MTKSHSLDASFINPEAIGVHIQLTRSIKHFLTGRTQRVSLAYNGHSSAAKTDGSGSLQGTVIGSASSLTFIDDISDAIDSYMYLFADDTKVYRGMLAN